MLSCIKQFLAKNRKNFIKKIKLVFKKFMFYIYAYVVPTLFFIFFYKRDHNDVASKTFQHFINYSSVWCTFNPNNSKLCTFKNLCYDSQLMTFLFFLNDLSVIKGFSHYKEFQTIQLSSVNSHNKFYANISVINSQNYKIKALKLLEKGLLFSRFKPDNIMHVFHDDLIPLYLTLEEICLGNLKICKKDYNLVIHDNHAKGPYFNLYKLYSEQAPIMLTQLPQNFNVICFQELHMGLVQHSVFYQYGFNQLQGPVENPNLSYNELQRFCSFIITGLNIETKHSNKTQILLVSRKKNRKIMNENQVIQMLENVFKHYNNAQELEIKVVDLFQNKTIQFIKEVAMSSVFVGMHGAEMIFSIFLRSNSTVIELFPYGIQPHIVSFIRPLSKLDNINFHYIYWKNKFKNLSVFHPEADALHGGIRSLSSKVQDEILNVEEVPAVQCCNNPMYLHYMYQDTWVESEFEKYLIQELKMAEKTFSFKKFDMKWFFPSPVRNVKCFYDYLNFSLNISWKMPHNVKTETSLLYDVFFIEINTKYEGNIITENTYLNINLPSNRIYEKFHIWLSVICRINNSTSKDVFYECS